MIEVCSMDFFAIKLAIFPKIIPERIAPADNLKYK